MSSSPNVSGRGPVSHISLKPPVVGAKKADGSPKIFVQGDVNFTQHAAEIGLKLYSQWDRICHFFKNGKNEWDKYVEIIDKQGNKYYTTERDLVTCACRYLVVAKNLEEDVNQRVGPERGGKNGAVQSKVGLLRDMLAPSVLSKLATEETIDIIAERLAEEVVKKEIDPRVKLLAAQERIHRRGAESQRKDLGFPSEELGQVSDQEAEKVKRESIQLRSLENFKKIKNEKKKELNELIILYDEGMRLAKAKEALLPKHQQAIHRLDNIEKFFIERNKVVERLKKEGVDPNYTRINERTTFNRLMDQAVKEYSNILAGTPQFERVMKHLVSDPLKNAELVTNMREIEQVKIRVENLLKARHAETTDNLFGFLDEITGARAQPEISGRLTRRPILEEAERAQKSRIPQNKLREITLLAHARAENEVRASDYVQTGLAKKDAEFLEKLPEKERQTFLDIVERHNTKDFKKEAAIEFEALLKHSPTFKKQLNLRSEARTFLANKVESEDKKQKYAKAYRRHYDALMAGGTPPVSKESAEVRSKEGRVDEKYMKEREPVAPPRVVIGSQMDEKHTKGVTPGAPKPKKSGIKIESSVASPAPVVSADKRVAAIQERYSAWLAKHGIVEKTVAARRSQVEDFVAFADQLFPEDVRKEKAGTFFKDFRAFLMENQRNVEQGFDLSDVHDESAALTREDTEKTSWFKPTPRIGVGESQRLNALEKFEADKNTLLQRAQGYFKVLEGRLNSELDLVKRGLIESEMYEVLDVAILLGESGGPGVLYIAPPPPPPANAQVELLAQFKKRAPIRYTEALTQFTPEELYRLLVKRDALIKEAASVKIRKGIEDFPKNFQKFLAEGERIEHSESLSNKQKLEMSGTHATEATRMRQEALAYHSYLKGQLKGATEERRTEIEVEMEHALDRAMLLSEPRGGELLRRSYLPGYEDILFMRQVLAQGPREKIWFSKTKNEFARGVKAPGATKEEQESWKAIPSGEIQKRLAEARRKYVNHELATTDKDLIEGLTKARGAFLEGIKQRIKKSK